MADIFKMITEGPRRVRKKQKTDARLNTILKNSESYEYSKKSNKKTDDENIISEFANIPNTLIGEERDKKNYLVDIPKISLKSLDEKPFKEQLKILKIEYNRIYDRLELLNGQLTNNEKTITDIRMQNRDNTEMNREMRGLIRHIVEMFPGNVELKDLVATGDWEKDSVFPLIERMVMSFIHRVKHIDDLIKQETEKQINENKMLKEKISQYKTSLEKIGELEEIMIKQKNIINKYKENELVLIDKVKAARNQTKKIASEYELKLKTQQKVPENNYEKEKLEAKINQLQETITKLNAELKEKPKVQYVEKIIEKPVEIIKEVPVYKETTKKQKDNKSEHNKNNEKNRNRNKSKVTKSPPTPLPVKEKENDKPITKNNAELVPLDVEDDLIPLDVEDDLIPLDVEDDLIPLDVEDDLIPLEIEDDLIPLDVEDDLLPKDEKTKSDAGIDKKAMDTKVEKKEKKESNELEPTHEPHFKEYFEKNAESIKIDKEKLAKASNDKNHPLSPDYVETEKEDVGVMFDQTVDAYIQNLSLQQEALLKLIGRTGISRTSDLKERLLQDKEASEHYVINGKPNNTNINRDISEMKARGVLAVDSINYGGRNGGNFNVFALSDTGKLCYKKITGENPVISEKQRIVQIHATLEHGYLIKDSAKIFREMGYKVYTDLSDVTFKIDNKKRKVFDFIIEDKEGKLMYIEVERGTHTQEGFSAAMDKIYEFTKDFYFICPNENTKNKNTRKKFFVWVTKTLGGIQNADVVLNMTTIDQLRKKPIQIWETTDLRSVQ